MLLCGGSSCRGRRHEVPDREAVAGGQLTEGDAGFADRYAQPQTGEEMDNRWFISMKTQFNDVLEYNVAPFCWAV